jgi:hypothetical protein
MAENAIHMESVPVLRNGLEPIVLVITQIYIFIFNSLRYERSNVSIIWYLFSLSHYVLSVCVFLLLCFSEDVDECALNRDKCDPLVQCVNYPGGYNCTSCPPGFNDTYQNGSWCIGIFFLFILIHNVFDSMLKEKELKYNWFIDIDECALGQNNCSQQGLNCTNVRGSYKCTTCPSGQLLTSQGCSRKSSLSVQKDRKLHIYWDLMLILEQFCGNGKIDPGEECDGGVKCFLNCTCAPGYIPTSPPSINCTSRKQIHFVW